AHPVLEAGLARLGWWTLAAERYPEAAAAFRAYLTSPRNNGNERHWVEAGLALSPVASDPEGARTTVRGPEPKRSPLVPPALVRLMRALGCANEPSDVSSPPPA